MPTEHIFIPSLVRGRYERLILPSLLYMRRSEGKTQLVTLNGILWSPLSLEGFYSYLPPGFLVSIAPEFYVVRYQIISFNGTCLQLPGLMIQVDKELRPQVGASLAELCPENAAKYRWEIGPDGILRRKKTSHRFH